MSLNLESKHSVDMWNKKSVVRRETRRTMVVVNPRRIRLIAFALIVVILGFSISPAQGATTFGRWRDIIPADYTSNVTPALRSVYLRNGGSGSIGAGDGWLVGGNSSGSIIGHYDGFSWQILASPTAGANYTSVHFCQAPGAPQLGGLCSPNGDGSDGWMVGGVDVNAGPADTPVAVYWDGYALTSKTQGLTSGRLYSVFEVCHRDGSGCGFNLASNGLTYAAGTDPTRTTGVVCVQTGDPKATPGGSWSCPGVLQSAPGNAHRFTSIYMYVDASNNLGGFAAGDMGDIATISGGALIDHIVAPSDVTFHSVFVSQGGSNLEAWAVGSAHLVQASIYHFCCGSAGLWAGVSPGATPNDLQSVFLVSQNEGWAVGNQSVILHSTNLGPAGTNLWTSISTPDQTGSGTGIDLLSVSFPSGGNGWAVGTKGVILNTQNSACPSITSPCWGGNTAISQTANLTTVFENSQSDTWAAGQWDSVNNARSIIHWDGQKWHRASVSPAFTPFNIWGIYMTGGSDGWAVGGKTDDTAPLALHWDGNQWSSSFATLGGCLGGGCSLRSVFMINSGEGWAVGTGGNIFHYTTSGGNQWSSGFTTTPATTQTLNSVFISNPGDNPNAGWAVGNAGTVAQLSISGGTFVWNIIHPLGLGNPGNIQNLYGVFFTDSSHGWIVGAKGTILTTTDGGNSWSGGAGQVVGGSLTTTLRSVMVDKFDTGAGNADGWAVGGTSEDRFAYATMAHWDGLTWTSTTISPPLEPAPGGACPSAQCGLALNSVAVKGTQDGWAVGSGTYPAWPSGPAPLAGIFHLDPLEPPTYPPTQYTTVTTTATTSSTSSTSTTGATASISTSTSSAQVTTMTSASTAATTAISTSISTSIASTTAVVTQTVTTASVTTPMALPAIPGFPWESIIAGIVIGMALLGIARRNKHKTP